MSGVPPTRGKKNIQGTSGGKMSGGMCPTPVLRLVAPTVALVLNVIGAVIWLNYGVNQ